MLSSEFADYFHKIPIIGERFLGCYSIDSFPSKLSNRQFFIANLSKQSQLGSHWITIIKSEPQRIEIFDSLGTQINILKPYLKFRGKPKIYYNEGPFQLKTSTTCGFFAIYFAVERCFNLDLKYKEFLAETFSSSLEENELNVVNFVKSL